MARVSRGRVSVGETFKGFSPTPLFQHSGFACHARQSVRSPLIGEHVGDPLRPPATSHSDGNRLVGLIRPRSREGDQGCSIRICFSERMTSSFRMNKQLQRELSNAAERTGNWSSLRLYHGLSCNNGTMRQLPLMLTLQDPCRSPFRGLSRGTAIVYVARGSPPRSADLHSILLRCLSFRTCPSGGQHS